VLPERHWFNGLGRRITDITISANYPVPLAGNRLPGRLLVIDVNFSHGEPVSYLLPVSFLPDHDAEEFLRDHPGAGLFRVTGDNDVGLNGVICDGMAEEQFTAQLLQRILTGEPLVGSDGEIRPLATSRLEPELVDVPDDQQDFWLWPRLLRGGQVHSTVAYGDRLILKLYRRREKGVSP
ncbi:MAG: hypothetical protein GY826_07045, partial [Fuerstiella sp.]|nr:hypothetical protein [Fuerstiella sp.]